jgi:hypothetical protein
MTTTKSDPEIEALAKAVNDSGFPLQLGVQRIATSNRRWRTELSEHAWLDPHTGDEKFIDLVVRNEQDNLIGPMRIVIESKRTANTDWIFLREREPEGTHDDNRISTIVRVLTRSRTQARTFNEWMNVQFIPGTPEVSFCVIRQGEKPRRDLLETIAAELVRATDALCAHEDAIHARQRASPDNRYPPLHRVYVPMIVTTARLFVCDTPYDAVDLQTGRVGPSQIKPVHAVRFKKSFGSIAPERSKASDIRSFAEEGERTVIVVQATYLSELLEMWDLGYIDVELKQALAAY